MSYGRGTRTKNPGQWFARQPNYKNVLLVLHEKPATAYDVAETLGMALTTIYKYLTQAHETHAIHIKAWIHPAERGPWRAVYAIGDGVDAEKPKPLPQAKRVEAYLARVKADPAKHAHWVRQRREYRETKKATANMLEGRKFKTKPVRLPDVPIDPLLKALGGYR